MFSQAGMGALLPGFSTDTGVQNLQTHPVKPYVILGFLALPPRRRQLSVPGRTLRLCGKAKQPCTKVKKRLFGGIGHKIMLHRPRQMILPYVGKLV